MMDPFEIFLIIFLVGLLALWIYALIEIIRSDFKGHGKVIWLIVLLFFGLLGVLIYLIAGRRTRITEKTNDSDVIDDI